MSTQEENFNLIKGEILKGSLQERLEYDVYDKVLNHDWKGLPEKSREKFLKFLEREGEVVVFSVTGNNDIEQPVAPVV
jgi:hypothetical protein